MTAPLFFPADAHEGPVWLPEQTRLYFTTKTHLEGRRRVDINYLDFSAYAVKDPTSLWDNLRASSDPTIPEHCFYHDAAMANSMILDADGQALLVCEQGDLERPSVISRITFGNQSRTVLIQDFHGKPFNSLNKIIRSKQGHLIISDPDYGFRQGFKPPPVLEPNVYVKTAGGDMHCFRGDLEMPHGIALSADERSIFLTDTSNDGGHDDDIELKRRRSVWRYDFDPVGGVIFGDGTWCYEVAEGVPDGSVVSGNKLLVGAGDGVYVSDLRGNLAGKILTEYVAVNVTVAGGGQHLFVTCDEGVLLYFDWAEHVQAV